MAMNADMLALIRAAKAKHSRGGLTKTIKPTDGKTTIRVLPPWDGKPDSPFWQDVGLHWIKPDADAKPVAVAGCFDHTYDQLCPICQMIDKAKKSADDDDQIKVMKEWDSKKSVLVNVIVRTGPNAKDEVQIMELSSTTFGAICAIIDEYSEDYDVLDPDNGLDFVIERTGKGKETRYNVMPAPKSKPVTKAQLDQLFNLAEFVETEHFAGGRDTKALNAIADLSGVAPVALSGKARAALTGPKATIVDAEVEDVTETAPPKRPAPKPAPVADDEPPFEVETPPARPAARPAVKAAPKPAPADELDDDLSGILDDLDSLDAA
ncbi:hypothetical protein [Azospirillum argentinense]|uniref:hypothetical protein n=1 Tax=Azospirillum argentinense TaxID=2970906 RepID=UPI0032DFCFE3